MHCQVGWQRDPKLFETMKKVMARVVHLDDERPEHIDGYLAERPDGLKDCMRVWSPCGCCWTYMSPNASVLTQCESAEHDFNWATAEEALNALRAAEEGERNRASQPGPNSLAIVVHRPQGNLL